MFCGFTTFQILTNCLPREQSLDVVETNILNFYQPCCISQDTVRKFYICLILGWEHEVVQKFLFFYLKST